MWVKFIFMMSSYVYPLQMKDILLWKSISIFFGIYLQLLLYWELPSWLSGEESTSQWRNCQRHRFKPWIGKILRNGKWQPTPILVFGKFHAKRSLAGYSPWGFKELTWLSNWAYNHDYYINHFPLHVDQEATVKTGHGTTNRFKIVKEVHQNCILSPYFLNF